MAFSLCPLLTQGAIDMLVHYGDDGDVETYLSKMVAGAGTMNLTEAQAGSDVGALSTGRAEPTTARGGSPDRRSSWPTASTTSPTTSSISSLLGPGHAAGTKRDLLLHRLQKFLVDDDRTLGERSSVECVSLEDKMGINATQHS